MVVSISDSLLIEIKPDLELDMIVGIQANDWRDFEDDFAIRNPESKMLV
jgi:hypothetical protein